MNEEITKKEIFNHLVLQGIFLDKNNLALAVKMVKEAKTSSIFQIYYELENKFNQPKFKTQMAQHQAAYVTGENMHQAYTKKASKPVEQLDKITGEVIAVHPSLYQAAKAIGKDKGYGVISNACRLKVKSAYGFNWRFKK